MLILQHHNIPFNFVCIFIRRFCVSRMNYTYIACVYALLLNRYCFVYSSGKTQIRLISEYSLITSDCYGISLIIDINKPAYYRFTFFCRYRVALCFLQQFHQFWDVLRKHIFIRVKNCNPIPARLIHCIVFCCGKVVYPLKPIDFCTQLFCQLHSTVSRTRVNNDLFNRDIFCPAKSLFNVFFFILDNHTLRESYRLRVLTDRWRFSLFLLFTHYILLPYNAGGRGRLPLHNL
jgi:hypothetical protein